MIRISSIVRAIEDTSVTLGGKIGAASKQLYIEASQEARARAMYSAETKAEREQRLVDLREAVKATDALFEAKRNNVDKIAEMQAEIDGLRRKLAAQKAATTRAKGR